MKPKLNKNLSLPWTPQGEKASENHQILLPRETAASLISHPVYAKLTQSHFLVLLYQLFNPADRAVVTAEHHHSRTATSFHYLWAKADNQKTTNLRKNFESAG